MRSIDYFFTLTSAYVYLGHEAFLDMARRHGATINFRPVRLAAVWARSGAVPHGQRPEPRQRYRLLELQRWREARGKPLNLWPAHFPVDPSLADRTAAALVLDGHDPAAFMGRVGRAVWAEEKNIADPDTLRAILRESGEDADSALARAESTEASSAIAANTAAAIAADVVGVPGYVLDGEAFWGQDRIDLLDRAMASGRPAFAADGR